MASSFNLIFFFFSFLSVLITSKSQISNLVFPVLKDLQTGQYITQIHLGYTPKPINLVVDLSGSISWFDCSHVSSSLNLISNSSSNCSKAKVGNDPISSSSSTGCELLIRNGVVGITARGELHSDVISFRSDSSPVTTIDLLYACTPPSLLTGLASEAQGVMGLGKAQISLPSQLAVKSSNRRRLTVYLSSLNGVVSTSSVEEVFGVAESTSLVYTPLLIGSSGSYVINVKSMRINGIQLAVDGPLTAEISTVVPYTMLESSIYQVFLEAYAKSARAATTSVARIAPFELCFTGEVNFPAVDLALQSEMVRWRIQGKNLMVDVGGGVRCLGILDGGSSPVNPIIIGGLQLEGFILDFDLGSSMLGFGPKTHYDLASL